MGLTLSEYLLRDFAVEHVDSTLIELGKENRVHFPAATQAYFHLVLSGTALLSLDESGQCVELSAGDFALLLYGAPHAMGCADALRSNAIHVFDRWQQGDEPSALKLDNEPYQLQVLSGSLQLARALRRAPVNQALPHLLYNITKHSQDGSDAALINDRAKINMACRGPGASAFVHALAQLHFVQVLRQVHDDLLLTFPIHIGAPEMGRMSAVVRKIHAHPEKRWTVALLAQEIGCSRSSFAAKFQAYAGIGPIKFVAKMRLTHAAALLKSNPDLPLWEVARRVSYDTQGSFTRAFKAQFGVSPRVYAEQFARDAAAKDHDPDLM